MTDTNNTPEITPELVAELLGNIKRHDAWEFRVAQVDSICYPPDSDYGSIRLNSMTAYAYSHQMRTGHHVQAIAELANNAPDIARAYLQLHEENARLRSALESITKHEHRNPGNTGELKIIAWEALKDTE